MDIVFSSQASMKSECGDKVLFVVEYAVMVESLDADNVDAGGPIECTRYDIWGWLMDSPYIHAIFSGENYNPNMDNDGVFCYLIFVSNLYSTYGAAKSHEYLDLAFFEHTVMWIKNNLKKVLTFPRTYAIIILKEDRCRVKPNTSQSQPHVLAC